MLKRVQIRGPRPQYGATHKKLAPLVLAANPICVRCRVNFSCHAHHKVYPATCVEDYEALCIACHKIADREMQQ